MTPFEVEHEAPRSGRGAAAPSGIPVTWRRRLHDGVSLTGVVSKKKSQTVETTFIDDGVIGWCEGAG